MLRPDNVSKRERSQHSCRKIIVRADIIQGLPQYSKAVCINSSDLQKKTSTKIMSVYPTLTTQKSKYTKVYFEITYKNY